MRIILLVRDFMSIIHKNTKQAFLIKCKSTKVSIGENIITNSNSNHVKQNNSNPFYLFFHS